jgi:hypothetical protein
MNASIPTREQRLDINPEVASGIGSDASDPRLTPVYVVLGVAIALIGGVGLVVLAVL